MLISFPLTCTVTNKILVCGEMQRKRELQLPSQHGTSNVTQDSRSQVRSAVTVDVLVREKFLLFPCSISYCGRLLNMYVISAAQHATVCCQYSLQLCFTGTVCFCKPAYFDTWKTFVTDTAAGLPIKGFFYMLYPDSRKIEQVLMQTCKVFVSSRLTASDIFVYTVLLIGGYLLTPANLAYAF